MSVSIFVHLLLMNVTVDRGIQGDGGAASAERAQPQPLAAIRLVRISRAGGPAVEPIREVPAPTVEPIPAELCPDLGDTAPTPTPADLADTAEGDDDPPRPRFPMGDPRLWRAPAPLSPPPRDPLRHERAGIRAHVDSVNHESGGIRIPPGNDMGVWTARDAEGRRWGLSPGRIHLGAVTVAMCSGDFDAGPRRQVAA